MLFLHVWSLGRDILRGDIELTQVPFLAVEHGFGGVEWLDRLLPSYGEEEFARLAEAQAAAGLGEAAFSLCLELDVPPYLVAEQVDRAKVLLGAVSDLGVKAVRVSLGGGGRGSIQWLLLAVERLLATRRARDRRPLGPGSRGLWRLLLRLPHRVRRGLPPRVEEGRLQAAAWALQPLARQAGELGMVLGVENHFGYTSHPQDLLRVLELAGSGEEERGEGWARRVGGGEVGVCLDTGNLLPGQDPARVAECLGPRAVHVHFKSFRPQDPAERRRNRVMLAALARAGYGGRFSVEYEGGGAGLAGAVAAARQWRELWEEVGGWCSAGDEGGVGAGEEGIDRERDLGY